MKLAVSPSRRLAALAISVVAAPLAMTARLDAAPQFGLPPVPPQLLRNTACTYVGGSVPAAGVTTANDRAQGVHVVPGGENIVIVGNTGSNNLGFRFDPLAPGWDHSHRGGSDAFVALLTPNLTGALGWTYLGGTSGNYEERAYGATTDGQNNVWVVGITASSNFPHPGGVAHHGAAGTWDGFVAKFSPDLSLLLFATCIGGSGHETPRGSLALDAAGNFYVSGETDSADFDASAIGGNNVHDATFNGGNDVFVAKFAPNGTKLWSTFLGGTDLDGGWSNVRVHPDGNSIYVAGYTRSSVAEGFPAQSGFDPIYNGDEGLGGTTGDGFVARFASNGQLLACTYIGGDHDETVSPNDGLELTPDGSHVVVIGQTRSTETGMPAFPVTANAFDQTHNGPTSGLAGLDGFVAVFDSTLATLDYCTYYGGIDNEEPGGLAVDTVGNIYFSGSTNSADFPTKSNGFDRTYAATTDAFLVKLSYDTVETTLGYATYFGGGNLTGDQQYADRGRHLALKPSNGRVVFSGDTAVSDFPTASNGAGSPVFGPTWSTGGTTDASEAWVAIHNAN